MCTTVVCGQKLSFFSILSSFLSFVVSLISSSCPCLLHYNVHCICTRSMHLAQSPLLRCNQYSTSRVFFNVVCSVSPTSILIVQQCLPTSYNCTLQYQAMVASGCDLEDGKGGRVCYNNILYFNWCLVGAGLPLPGKPLLLFFFFSPFPLLYSSDAYSLLFANTTCML